MSALMGTDLCTRKGLEGPYGAKPTIKIIPTQPTINISMEEMKMTVSEHSIGFCSLLFPHGELGLSRCLRKLPLLGTVSHHYTLLLRRGRMY